MYEAREMYDGKYISCAVKTQNLPTYCCHGE